MKTSSWTGLLAFVLVLAMMFQMLPAQALALDGVNSAANQEDEPDGEEPYSLTVLGEVESLREEKIKHFRLSDGSFVAVSYGMPVHYQDGDGQWQDIDNSLLLEAESLETANECAPAAFSRDLAEGEIFTASQGDYSVSMSLLDTVEPVALTAEKANAKADMTENAAQVADRIYDRAVEAAVTDEVPTMLQLQEKYVWDVQDVIPEKLQSSLVYRDVFPGIDLLYTAFGYNIKEQIVVNEPQSAYRFDFLLETDGLSAVLNDDGSVSFLDGDGEAHYEIPAPYMVDAIGVYSDQVSFTLSEDARGYVLTVEADEEWINDEEREFPVNIDPTLAVVSGQALQDIYSVYTMEAAPNDTTLGRQWLYVGAQPYSTSNDGRYRIYMHFQNMPSIPSGSEVVHADLSLYKTAYTQRYCPQFPIGAYEVTTSLPSSYTSYYDWFSKMTWRRDQPTYDTTNAIDFAFGKTGKEYLHWNLTELVKKWYIEGTDNTTIALAMMNEDEIDTYYYFASATFYAYAGSIPPILTVSYRNNTGIEPYYTYRTMGAGEAGTAYVADATGQLKIAKELVSYASNTNPFSLNLVYNSDYFSSSNADYNPLTQLGLSMSVGSGWTLDCVQKVTAETISGVSYLKYADGDGTIHYFCKDSSRDASYYYDEDGLGLKIKDTGTNAYTMSDDKGNEWIFTGNFLTSTKDSDGNVFNINYSNGKISTITQVNNGQSAITVASLAYSGNNLTSVTDAAGNIYTLTYSGTKLAGVQRGTTKLAEYLYNGGDSRVTRMADSESGYGINFTYSTGKLSGYEEVMQEVNGQITLSYYAQAVTISYPAHSETVYKDYGVDRISGNYDDLSTHYLFDYAGRTVNAYTTDSNGNIQGASNALYVTNSGTSKKNNRMERTATIGIAAQQLMRNPGVETTDNAWITSTGASVSTEKPRTGLTGIKGFATSVTDVFVSNVSEALENGKTYTFSCFVNTSNVASFQGDGIFLSVSDGSGHGWTGEPIHYVTSPTIDDGWVRISLTFMAQSNDIHTLILRGEGVIGTFYADDFQLEEGEAPSTFNLVENGSMEMVGHAWVTGTNANFVYGTDLGVANSQMSIQILGDPEESGTNAYQDIPLNLPASQTYVLSGWAKANAVPDSPDDVTKKCGLRATIYYSDGTTEGHYVPFNSDISNQWQFTSMTIVPKKTTGAVIKIRVTLAYEGNANTCFFDNISLLREAAQTMKYDADGNLVSVTTSGLAEDTNTYANGNLIQTITGGNGTFTYTYDTANTHRLNSVTNGQITQSMGYDATGNVTSATLSGTGGKSIQSSAVYTGSGNRVSSVTDAAGSTVSYAYGNANAQMRGQPTSVTAPNGTVTNSAYDSSGRVTQTGVANTASLQYTYDKGNLSTVQRTNNGKTQTYDFTYDYFGNMLTAKVGSRTLATNTYGFRSGLLSEQVYGNGDTLNFFYDKLGRIRFVRLDDGCFLNYVYNGEGQLHSLTKTGNGADEVYLYTYDSIGRLIHSERQENGTSILRTSQRYNEKNQLTGQSWQLGSTDYSEGYTYNTDGSMNYMFTATGNVLSMTYDGLQRLTAVNGGPVERRYVYRDIDSAKTTMQVASVTSGWLHYGYTYDSMGNIATYSAPGKGTVTYTYDNQGQLLKAVGDTTYTYTYDGAGNILTASNGTTTHTYTYGDADWKDLLTAFDGQSITYDAIGNPTSYYNGTRWAMTWANGRSLATASKSGTSLSFAYDASGLRTSKVVNGTTYRYYYAGGKLMRMTWGTNTIDFFYDASGLPYAMKYNGTVYYYVTNLQGDVMRIVNASGTVVASYDYDPYGKVISATGTLANVNPLRYRGYVYDQETGFYYLQSRYYDPAIGRFLNADGYASTGQGIIGHNMFAYCLDNPVSYIDREGTYAGVLTSSDALQWWITTASWLPFADVYLPVGDIIFLGVAFVLGAGALAEKQPPVPEILFDEVEDVSYGPPSPNGDDDDEEDDYDYYYDQRRNSSGREKIGKSKGGTPGNNQSQNKQFNDATKGLTADQKRFVHDLISKQGLGYHEIKEIVKDLFIFVVSVFATKDRQ